MRKDKTNYHSNFYKLEPISPINALRQLRNGQMPRPMCQSITNVIWQMPLAVGRLIFLETYMLFIMVPIIGRRQFHLSYVHKPELLC